MVLDRELLSSLALLLEYPTEEIPSVLERCSILLTPYGEDLARKIGYVRDFVEKEGLEKLRDVYTYTFDLTPACPPYVGHYVFGEDYRRSYFMVGLKETYRRYGFGYDERELPDHISLLVRFLPLYENEEEREELIELCVLPALREMVKSLKDENPYRKILEVFLAILGGGE